MAKRIIRHTKRNKLMWKLILFAIVLIGSTAVLFDSLQTHQKYKDSRLVDAKVVDIAGRDNGTIKVTYKYTAGKKAYKSFKLQKPKEINIGDETEIRISESKPKKIFNHNREENAVFPQVAVTFLFFAIVATLIFG